MQLSTPPLPPPLGAIAREFGSDTDVVWTGTVRGTEDLAQARHDVASALQRADIRSETIADVSLAMTELVVNAITHGAADVADVLVFSAVHEPAVVLVVAYVDHGASDVQFPPAMAPPGALHGRGRAIVQALADSFETSRRSDGTLVNLARFAA